MTRKIKTMPFFENLPKMDKATKEIFDKIISIDNHLINEIEVATGLVFDKYNTDYQSTILTDLYCYILRMNGFSFSIISEMMGSRNHSIRVMKYRRFKKKATEKSRAYYENINPYIKLMVKSNGINRYSFENLRGYLFNHFYKEVLETPDRTKEQFLKDHKVRLCNICDEIKDAKLFVDNNKYETIRPNCRKCRLEKGKIRKNYIRLRNKKRLSKLA